ncbi:MAG: FAD:protein FMN transferase, partial [Phycisphaerales bacterium]
MAGSPFRVLLLVILIVSPLTLCCCSSSPQTLQRFEYAQIIMGIEARIILYAPEESVARSAARSAFDRMVRLESAMSDYRLDSELMRVCESGEGGKPVSISDDLYRVLDRARSFSEATDGAFDVTIGPVVQLWRDARRSGALPAPKAISRAQEAVGWKNLILEPESRTIRFQRPGMRLDLGGIGKGFAADEAMAVLID